MVTYQRHLNQRMQIG